MSAEDTPDTSIGWNTYAPPTADIIDWTADQSRHLGMYPRFQQYCAYYEINPDDPTQLEYWDAASSFFSGREWETYSATIPSDARTLLQLFIASPRAVYAQALLHADSDPKVDAQERSYLKASAIRFNRLLYNAALYAPDMAVPSLKTALHHTVAPALDPWHLTQKDVRKIIRSTIRGVQHELAFRQILSYIGYDCRQSTEAEDGNGTDYILSLDDGTSLRIDVKARRLEVMSGTSKTGYYYLRKDATIVIASLVSRHDFVGKMFITPAIAEQKAPVLQALLTDAVRRQGRRSARIR